MQTRTSRSSGKASIRGLPELLTERFTVTRFTFKRFTGVQSAL